MTNTEIFYHGTCYIFDKFSLSFLGSGEGKSKFGQGIYITSSYKTAALYAAKAAKANGKKLGRPALTFPANWDKVYASWKSGEITAKTAMEMTDTKRTSFYKLVGMMEEE